MCERDCACVRETVCVCVCERERLCKRERDCMCVCGVQGRVVKDKCLTLRERTHRISIFLRNLFIIVVISFSNTFTETYEEQQTREHVEIIRYET